MSVDHYPIGQGVTIHLEARNKTGVLADVTTGNLKVRAPDGSVTTTAWGSLTHVSTGVYELDVLGNQTGRWNWYGNTTAPFNSAHQGYFVVDPVEWATEYP